MTGICFLRLKGVLLTSVVRSNKMKDFSLEVKIPINFIFQDGGEIKTLGESSLVGHSYEF